MRMMILAALAATAAAPTHADVVKPAARCADRTGLHFADAASPARFDRLDRLPPAALVLTVFREVGGCPTPVVVRYGIGANAAVIDPATGLRRR